jgi:hypothetical protein
MAGNICDVCGTQNEPGAAFCVSCHSYLAWDETGLTVLGPPAGRGQPIQQTTGTGPSGFTTSPTGASSSQAGSGGPAAGTGQRGQGQPTVNQQRAQLVNADELFQVFAEQNAVTVAATGEPATFVMQVNNSSNIVDGFTADAPSAPPWLSIQSTQIDLLPGTSDALAVTMRVSSQTLVPAQQFQLVLRILSSNQAPAQQELPVMVTVPVIDVPVRLQPSPRLLRVRDHETGECTVAVDNTSSNQPVRLRFSGTDPELAVRFHFDPPVLDVGPATTGSVRVVMVAPRPAAGEEVTRSLTVTANDGTRNVEAPITFQQSSSVSAMTTLALRVEPSIVRVQDVDGAMVQVVIDNRRGTSALRLFLEGRDPERAIGFAFNPPVVDIGPGQVQPVGVRLDSWRPAPGQEWTRQFTITASDGRTTVEGSGSLVQASSRAAIELLGIRIDPRVLRMANRRKGVLRATVDNRNGAQPVRVSLRGDDPESIIRFTFNPALVDVPPGRVAVSMVTLRAPRPGGGQELTRPFTVMASDGRVETRAEGSVIQSQAARRPAWRIILTLLGAAAMIFGALLPWRGNGERALDLTANAALAIASRFFRLNVNLGMFGTILSAGLLMVAFALLMVFGLTGPNGGLSRKMAFLATLLLVGVFVALAVAGEDFTPARGAFLSLAGCVTGYIAGLLAKR